MALASAALPMAFISNLRGPDLLIIAALALLIFGKRLPEVGKNLGQAIVGFKKGLKETGDEISAGVEEATEPPARPVTDSNVKASTLNRDSQKKMLRNASDEP